MKWFVFLLVASVLPAASAWGALSSDLIIPATSTGQLEAYLQANPECPLNRLPPLAKKRFLAGIRFNERGLAGLSTAELAYGFSKAELEKIGALIGYPITQVINGTENAKKRQAISQVSQSVAQKFDTFYYAYNNYMENRQTNTTKRDKIELFKQYQALFSINSARLAKIENGDLLLLFRAASMLDYENNKAVLQDMKQIVRELEKRQLAVKAHYSKIYDILLARQLFEQARLFSNKHGFDPLPDIVNSSGLTQGLPSILVVSPDKNQLVHKSVDLSSRPTILVVAHPFCHFCHDAVAFIEADDQLRNLFSKYSLWLSPAYYRNVEEFQHWNKKHPVAQISMIYSEDEWPGIMFWSTPRFYFLKNGKPVALMVGLPVRGKKKALLEGMLKIGILETAATP